MEQKERVRGDLMEKTNFNKWNKKALIDLLKFFEYNFPINFKEVMNRFEEWKRGD